MVRGPLSDSEGMPAFGGWGEAGGRAWEGTAGEMEGMPALQVCVRSQQCSKAGALSDCC